MQQAQQLESSSAVPAISTATNPRKRRNSDPSSQLSTSLQQQSNSFNSYGTPEYAHNEVAVLNDNQQQLQQRIFDTTIYSHNPAASTAPFIIRSRHHSSSTPDIANMRASDLRVPGMFRRTFIHAQASRQGRPPPNFLTKSFIDFLALYGFYGGDVVPEEDDDEDGDVPDDNRTLASDSSGESGGGESATNHDSSEAPNSPPISASNNQSSCPPPAEEYTPLLSSSNIINNPTTNTSSQQGTSAGKAFFLLMKAFVGTGVLFLPKAFSNGGMGFSLILLLVVGILTLHCMLLLVDTSRELGGLSFGDMGERLYGANMRKLILGSIAVAQVNCRD